jgi:hypothetical protein
MQGKWRGVLLVVGAVALGACPSPGPEAPAGDAGATLEEADRTRRMEEKAAEIRRMEEEIRTMEGTEDEKIDAVNRLDAARRELMEMQDEGSGTP